MNGGQCSLADNGVSPQCLCINGYQGLLCEIGKKLNTLTFDKSSPVTNIKRTASAKKKKMLNKFWLSQDEQDTGLKLV